MVKDPATLMRGLVLSAAWLAWFFAGLMYARMHGPVASVLSRMSQFEKVALAFWLLVSTLLLYYALVVTIRGLAGSSIRPRA
jgi:hypothetical protein